MAKTGKARIIEILQDNPGLSSTDIAERTGTTYDTVQTHLTEMVNSDQLKRKGYGNPWCFYYYTPEQFEKIDENMKDEKQHSLDSYDLS